MKNYILWILAVVCLVACKKIPSKTTTYSHDFEMVKGDPSNTLIYTLENGLKVYLSVNELEPRIQTLIAVKAGSKFDPEETTGLAHYLEHMMFKGTHNMGTKDWSSEKDILDQIAATFEQHKEEKNPKQKVALYAKIDSLSLEASKFAIANEYDKMVSSLGAKGTNAYTSNDETVYMNDIPSNEIEKWLKLEGERFQTLVLRLFHTELETVYEEFNRSQDSDNRWVYQGVLEGLLPNHPYGTQTTIGVGEHLKNPSLYNIHEYFDTYYVPNNIAICLSGDLDPDQTVDIIEEYFGKWERKDVPEFVANQDIELSEAISKETFGPQQELLYLGFKFDGAGSKEARMIQIIDMLLANSQAGLIDIDLVLKQKVLNASSFAQILKDHSIHFLYGIPKENQSLEEVKDLLLAELQKIKQGDFDEWLLEAVVNDLKISRIKSLETNRGRASLMIDAFINELDYQDVVFDHDSMALVTKAEVIEFVNEHYGENYVVSYKRIGESDRHSVPKPKITAVEVDRENQSAFYMEFDSLPSKRLTPKFLDFEKDITLSKLNDVEIAYAENKNNEVFNLYYLFDLGTNTDKELALAIQYLPYLGTSTYSAEDLQKEFYRYGLEFGVNAGSDQVSVSLTGLEENLDKGIELFEHILANVQADSSVYAELVSDVLKARVNAKLDKNTILRSGLGSYAKYGPVNPFTDRLSMEQIESMRVDSLVKKIHALSNIEHRIFYFGAMSLYKVKGLIAKHHTNTSKLNPIPKEKKFEELVTSSNKVFYAPYDMQQVEIFFISKDEVFNPEMLAGIKLFNEYFGAGLSSIVFQEIREKKALAYSAYSYISTPTAKEKSHYVNAYIGTQADKLSDATSAMFELMNDMPEAEMQFNAAKEAVTKKLESDWTTGSNVYWQYERAKKLGVNYDLNQKIYTQVQEMELSDLKIFFNNHVKGNEYSICVIGNKSNMDFGALETLGELKQLELEELFGY
ncbi:MAG: insulinase family protein [Chitinophagales bacterium]|jgi:zinc protease|tara:strand:- start:4613 stop:7525 length:2913 start_codon:yes stop_codon:yes gene_type:complete